MNRQQKVTLLTFLYVSQGLPHGFFTQFLPVVLRQAGVSISGVVFANLLTLPWAFKFLWAPAVDIYGLKDIGRRRSWLLPLQITMTLIYGSLAFFVVESDLRLVMGAFFIMNFLAATQDIATDGLAVDILEYHERGWANGIQVAAYRVGMVITGVLLLKVFADIGWFGVMIAIAGINFLCTLPVFFLREKPREAAENVRFAGVTREILHFITSRRGALAWLVVLLVYKFGHTGASSMMRLMLVDQKREIKEIADIMGFGGIVAGLLGAISGGLLASYAGSESSTRQKLLVALGALQTFAVCTYLWPAYSDTSTFKVVSAVALDHFTSGVATTFLFTLMMDACSKERAASDYTLQASTVVVSQSLASIVAGVVADLNGYLMSFIVCASVAVFAILFTWWVIKMHGENLFSKAKSVAAKGAVATLLFGSGFLGSIILPDSASAQESQARNNEYGIHAGPFLPRKIPGVREILSGWGARASFPSRKGLFEIDTFIARDEGTSYNILSGDYRIDIQNDTLPAHFLLGLHADYYTSPNAAARSAGGWHFGGGIKQKLAGAFSLRSDFKYRFGPGTSLYVGVGLSFELPSDSN